MSTPFIMTRDINGYNGFGLPFALDKYSATLATGADTTLTVPSAGSFGRASAGDSNYFIAIFSYEPGARVWVASNATAAVPVGATFAAVSSELNPAARMVKP